MISHYFISGWQSIMQHKSRSQLSIFVIAIASILLSLSFALEKGTNNQLQSIAEQAPNTQVLRDKGFSNFGYDRPSIPISAYEQVSSLTDVVSKSFEYSYFDRVMSNDNVYETSVVVSNNSYARLRGFELTSGEFTLRAGSNEHLVVIGSKLANAMFGENNGVGNKIQINDKELTVVGVLNQVNDLGLDLGREIDDSVIMGVDTYKTVSSNSLQSIDQAFLQLRQDSDQTESRKLISETISEAGLKPDNIELTSYSETMRIGSEALRYLTIIRGSLVLAVLVGGASVANAMTAVATSRQREIGLRKSVGASSADIFWQHVIEPGLVGFAAAVLSIVGTLVAILVGQSYYDILLSIDIVSMALVAFYAALLPLIFGLQPAISAARTKANSALRHE